MHIFKYMNWYFDVQQVTSTYPTITLKDTFKYTGGAGVSYYCWGLVVWPAFHIFKCHYSSDRLKK